MVRAFSVCAVLFAACTAAAQTATPSIISQPQIDEKLGIAAQEPTPVVACESHECPSSNAASCADKPVDKHALLKQKLAELNCLQSEIDQLRAAIGTPQQILLKLKVVEVSRTKLEKLGLDIAALRGDVHGANVPFKSPPKPFVGAEFATIDDSKAVEAMLEKLHQNGVARTLAEPTLVTVSGRPAQLNVGGEVPLPTAPGSQQAVEYKPFGTHVDVLAIAQGDSRVRLELRARVSEIDQSKQVEVGGVVLPAITSRQVATGLDLGFGQTGVLSGLVQRRTEHQKLEDKSVESVELVELLFLVTPELVDSNDASLHTRTLGTIDAAKYRTATRESKERPGERSLRVTKPSAPR